MHFLWFSDLFLYDYLCLHCRPIGCKALIADGNCDFADGDIKQQKRAVELNHRLHFFPNINYVFYTTSDGFLDLTFIQNQLDAEIQMHFGYLGSL